MQYCDIFKTVMMMRRLSKVNDDWKNVYHKYVKVVVLIFMMQLLKIATDAIVVVYFSVLIVIVNHWVFSDHGHILAAIRRYLLILTNKDG